MYKYIDVSNNTLPEVTAVRKLRRRGVVLHETIGTNSLAWLQGDSAKHNRPASSDFLVNRHGDIYQLIRPGYYSYHSGRALWNLYQDSDGTLNQSYVGIEIENHPGLGQVIASPQYVAVAALLRRLIAAHSIPFVNIVGHYQVARPIGRKQDPATLNWAMLTTETINPSPEQSLYTFPAVLP